MKNCLPVLALLVLVGCDEPSRGGDPAVQAAYADSPWKVSLHGTVALARGEKLKPGPHRLDVWVQPKDCGVHAVTVFFREDGQWSLDLAVERAECAYGGELVIKSARINGRKLHPVQERHPWRVMGEPLILEFTDG